MQQVFCDGYGLTILLTAEADDETQPVELPGSVNVHCTGIGALTVLEHVPDTPYTLCSTQ